MSLEKEKIERFKEQNERLKKQNEIFKKQNERCKKDTELSRFETLTCKNDIEKYKEEIEFIIEMSELEMVTCKNDIENIKQEWESNIGDLDYQTSQLQQESERPPAINEFCSCSSSPTQANFLEPNATIIISLIRNIDGAREIDTCSGRSTKFGYLTSNSCCQADEFILYDLNDSKHILIDENSLWIEENICLINRIESIDLRFPISDKEILGQCSLSMFDNEQGGFNDHKLEFQILGCFDSPCELKIDPNSYRNQTILNGTLILCDHSPHSAIVTKSTYIIKGP